MTPPNKLVKAGAEAICAARTVECRRLGCCEFYEDHARLALAAAFAALLECEEARASIIRSLTPCLAQPLGPDDLACYLLNGHDGDHMFAFPRAVYADAALAALAREFGGSALLLCDNCGKAMASHGALAECYPEKAP